MHRPRRSGRRAVVLLGAVLLAAVAAAPALGALPRTYQVQRIDSPEPSIGGRFGDGVVSAGDVDRDGRDDILVGIDEHGTVAGKVFIFSGADGSLIRGIGPVDPSTTGNPTAFGAFVGRMADVGSCPGGTSGAICPAAAIGAADGVDEQIVSAVGVDIGTQADMGRVYVIDGATGAVLKRIQMPAGDRAELAGAPGGPRRSGFGRTVANPSSPFPSTAGPAVTPPAVLKGDLDGAGQPDVVVGASDYFEAGPATNPACAPGPCTDAGRFYVYRGEDIAGTDPAAVLETPFYTLKNPSALDDGLSPPWASREAMGYSAAPLGDVGRCSTTTVGPGELCVGPANTNVPDGKPDWVASSHRSDVFGMGDAGIAYVIDGATGRILQVLTPPEPQQTAIFAFSNYNQPSIGDVADSVLPDIYQGAMVQNVDFRSQGRGWVLNGNVKVGANGYVLSVLDDPTPSPIGNFGTSSAGVGNVFGDSRNEIMIGAYGPHAPGIIDSIVNDVHIFSPLTSAVLQTIQAPDPQPGAGFGRALAPLGNLVPNADGTRTGDLNGDGLLDFVVGAGGFNGSAGADQGRVYVFRSDDSPAPAAAAPAPQPAASAARVLAGRSVDIVLSRRTARRGQRVVVRGRLEAFANGAECRRGQRVVIQRRAPGSLVWRGVRAVTTDARGRFSARVRVPATALLRARVAQSEGCFGAVSAGERVTVVAAARHR